MHVQHGTSVVVTDGCKALLLRNEGDAEFPDLRLIQKWEQHLQPDRELKRDSPGRTFSSHDHGARRSSYEETNFHETAEALFASRLATFLNGQALQNAIGELLIVAPPRTLGELRKHLGNRLSSTVIAEIPKDLVKHPIAEIERLITCYPEPVRFGTP